MSDTAEPFRNRFYGKYRGTVIDVDASTMCVKANVPAVLNDVATGWSQPCVPYAGPQSGFFMLPDIGAQIWVEFEAGDVARPIWTGGYWAGTDIPGSTKSAVKTIVTSAGSIAFDAGAGSVTITGPQGQSIVLDSSGITISAGAGSIKLGASGVNINNGGLEVT